MPTPVRFLLALLAACTVVPLVASCSGGDTSGQSGASSTGSVPCDSCNAISQAKGSVNNVCSGAAEEALGPLVVCMCNTCSSTCLMTTCQGTPAPADCLTCLNTSCKTELTKCQAN